MSRPNYYAEYDLVSFPMIKDLGKRIDRFRIDRDLLDAAIFWRTNKERQRYSLSHFPMIVDCNAWQDCILNKCATTNSLIMKTNLILDIEHCGIGRRGQLLTRKTDCVDLQRIS